ncbi:Ribosomal protein L44 [Parelaphostrongylus tenuis]|uniref:Ribosomal protein L44 n=1 Tax=Parelaphostrongylus tenuis TaxID=148309 RepID=A0AAD5MH28_PARTN|nr:Ribosomal protein L44 [Parelaphostrongylus tenuis]
MDGETLFVMIAHNDVLSRLSHKSMDYCCDQINAMPRICGLGVASIGAVIFLLKSGPIVVGRRRYDRRQAGFDDQTKPICRKKAKTTKKIALRMECTECKHKKQLPIKRWAYNLFKIISLQTYRFGLLVNVP